MRVLFYAVLVLLCLLLAGITFLFVAGPSDLLRDQLVDAVKARTGRDLAINGATSFTLYPSPGLAMDDVTLSDPPAMGAAPFARIARLEMSVPFRSLLRQKLAVERVVLKGAVVDLRIDATGRRNWDFASLLPDRPASARRAAVVPRIRLASADHSASVLQIADATAAEPVASPPVQSALAIEDVQLIDGIVRFANETTGRREEMTGLHVRARLPRDSAHVALDGKGTWRNEDVQVQGTVGAGPATTGSGLALALKFAARTGELSLDGSVTMAASPQFQGKVQTSTPSLRTAAGWLGGVLPPVPAIEAVALSGAVTAQADQIMIKDLAANVDGNAIRGELAVLLAASRPFLRGVLAVEKLNLNSYLGLAAGGAGTAGTAATPGRAKPGVNAAGSGNEAGGIGDLIESIDKQPPPAPSVPPPQRPAVPAQVRGWSSQPYDLAILQMADADLKLDIGRVIYRDLVLDRSKIAATLNGGVLKAVIPESSVYKGRGSGALGIDVTGPVPKLTLQAKIEGADTLALLKASAGFDRVAGRGSVTINVAGQGQTQQQMTESLSGTAALSIADGAMFGFDIAGMVKQAQKGQLPQLAINPAEKTDFQQMSGTFVVSGGVAQSQDLLLVSTALRAGGTGSFDLGKQLMDLRLKPKLAANAQSPGGLADLANLDVPILIRGPWDAPRVTVDLDGVVKDNSQIKKGVEQLGEVLKSKEGQKAAKEIGRKLRDLLGR